MLRNQQAKSVHEPNRINYARYTSIPAVYASSGASNSSPETVE